MDHGEVLSIQDVQELGISCRLALTPEELEKYRGDLNDLLALIAVLEETEAQEASPIGSATLAELREAMIHNFGKTDSARAEKMTEQIALELSKNGVKVNESLISEIYNTVKNKASDSKYAEIRKMISEETNDRILITLSEIIYEPLQCRICLVYQPKILLRVRVVMIQGMYTAY